MISQRGINLAAVYQKLPIAFCIVGRDGVLLAVNDLHAELAGREIDELIGVSVADLHPEGGRNVQRDFRYFDAGKVVPNHELEIRGRIYLVSVSPVFDADGKVAAISVAHQDISEQKATERRIQRMNRRLEILSKTDHLTRTLNRRQFDRSLFSECEALEKSGRELALILFDVDHFKAYNDLYGHQAGDRCLQLIAWSAKRVLRKSDVSLCRIGGEEFAALVTDAEPVVTVTLASRICDAVRACRIPHERSDKNIVTVSCGVASTLQIARPLSRSADQQLLRAADQALYHAKRTGRDTISVFNPLGTVTARSGASGFVASA